MRDELLTPDLPVPEMDETMNAAGREHWEQEKEKLTLALAERLLRGRDSVAFAELKKAPIFLERGIRKVGEMVLALLRQQARQIIRQEKPLVLQSKRHFELDDDDIRGQLRRLRDLLADKGECFHQLNNHNRCILSHTYPLSLTPFWVFDCYCHGSIHYVDNWVCHDIRRRMPKKIPPEKPH